LPINQPPPNQEVERKWSKTLDYVELNIRYYVKVIFLFHAVNLHTCIHLHWIQRWSIYWTKFNVILTLCVMCIDILSIPFSLLSIYLHLKYYYWPIVVSIMLPFAQHYNFSYVYIFFLKL
jgi:hypothetical protein